MSTKMSVKCRPKLKCNEVKSGCKNDFFNSPFVCLFVCCFVFFIKNEDRNNFPMYRFKYQTSIDTELLHMA